MKTYRTQMPMWLRNLPDGIYTLTELQRICKRTKSYISRRFKKMGVTRHVDAAPSYRNIVLIQYEWKKSDFLD